MPGKNTMARQTTKFSLPQQARRSLNDMLHKGVHSARKLNRARILLKLDQGLKPPQVAQEVGVCLATVYNIRNKATKTSWLQSLEEAPRSDHPIGTRTRSGDCLGLHNTA